MTYHITTSAKAGGGLEYHINWKGRIAPIAVCADHRDAQRICDALNDFERTHKGE